MAAPACDVDPEAVRSCHDGAVLRRSCKIMLLILKAEPLVVSHLGVARLRSCMAWMATSLPGRCHCNGSISCKRRHRMSHSVRGCSIPARFCHINVCTCFSYMLSSLRAVFSSEKKADCPFPRLNKQTFLPSVLQIGRRVLPRAVSFCRAHW